MKTSIKTFSLLVAATGLAMIAPAFAGSNVKIIANPSVKADSISAEELKSVFLEEKLSLSDGSRVEPVVSRGGRTHEAFLREYLGKSDSDLQTYYRSLVFTGKGAMPKAIVSDSELAAYVAKTRGAIGYVSSGMSRKERERLMCSVGGKPTEARESKRPWSRTPKQQIGRLEMIDVLLTELSEPRKELARQPVSLGD